MNEQSQILFMQVRLAILLLCCALMLCSCGEASGSAGGLIGGGEAASASSDETIPIEPYAPVTASSITVSIGSLDVSTSFSGSEYYRCAVSGTVTNTASSKSGGLDITIGFYDAVGTRLDYTVYSCGGIAAGGTRSFSVTEQVRRSLGTPAYVKVEDITVNHF